MKKDINIYTNIENFKFFRQILPQYNLSFKHLNELSSKNLLRDEGGIIINKNFNKPEVDFSILKKNYIVFTCDKNTTKLKNNILIIQAPLFPYQLKNNIENFLNRNSLQIGDLLIDNQKIENLNNNKSCSLTEIENKILFYLINNNLCTKENIKENILNIKSTIETNSVESHLTRIRKKIDSLETNFKIKTKKNVISIEINQKK